MEILIVICLLIIIALLLHGKIVIKKTAQQKPFKEKANPELPDIMGQPKPPQRLSVPSTAIESRIENPLEPDGTFVPETRDSGRLKVVPQEELDEVFDNVPDLDEEGEEWQGYGEPNSESGFATGVTFNELTTVGTLLGKEHLAPTEEQQAVDIVRKIQGTELFDLLENSIESASQKIAKLLEGSIQQTDFGSSTTRDDSADGFDIGEFA